MLTWAGLKLYMPKAYFKGDKRNKHQRNSLPWVTFYFEYNNKQFLKIFVLTEKNTD